MSAVTGAIRCPSFSFPYYTPSLLRILLLQPLATSAGPMPPLLGSNPDSALS